MLWHFRKKSVDFYGDSDAVLGKLHENHLNLLIDPNYSTLFEILYYLCITEKHLSKKCLVVFEKICPPHGNSW